MVCVKCKAELPENAMFCHLCGKKQGSEKKRRPRHGNGSGTVRKLTGKRKKPWAAYTPAFWDGEKYERIYLGTFETEREAREAIRKVAPRALKASYRYTVADVYEAWKGPHFATIGPKGAEGYEGAWRHCEAIKAKNMRDIHTEDFQRIVNNLVEAGRSRSLCEKVKQLASQLCKWAVENDVLSRNMSEALKLPKIEEKERKVFSIDEILKIKELTEDKRLGETAKIAMVLIYTGMRIGELLEARSSSANTENSYLIAGNKTAAGKNRIVTYPDFIAPYVEQWKCQGGEYLIPSASGGMRSTDNVRKSFGSLMQKLGIEGASPHTCRRTCATMLSRNGERPEIMSKLLGHASYDTTEIYIINNLEDLKKASNALQCEQNANKVESNNDKTIYCEAK